MAAQQKQVPISECRICKNLKDVETSFIKFGWEDHTIYLPDAVKELVPAEEMRAPGKDRHHVRRCPLCGRLYRYDVSSDYYINGSEDEETLTRLTAEETRRFLDAQKSRDGIG